LYWF